MSQGLGARGLISIEEELVYKTAILSPDANKVYFKSESLKSERNLISSETITGSRESTQPVRGNINVSGDITVELQAYMGILLKATFGEVITATHEIDYTSSTAEFKRGQILTDDATGAGTVVFDDTVNQVLHIFQTAAFASGELVGTNPDATTTNAQIAGAGTPASGSYCHRFVIGTSLPSLAIDKGFYDIAQYFLYRGCKVNSMGFSVVPEGFQDVAFSFIGAAEDIAQTPTDASPTDEGKSSFDGFSVSTLEENNVAIANVTIVDGLTIENNLDDSVYVIDPLNPGERAALPAGLVKVTGSVTALFEDLTLYQKAVDNTETSLRVAYKLGTGLGTAGNEYIEFYVPELYFSQSAPVIEGGTGVKVTLPFEAFYSNSTEASTIDCVLRNTTVSYPDPS